MSTAGDIKVGLVLDGADEFRVQITRAADSLDKIASKMEAYGRASNSAERHQRRLISGFREYALNIELARVTIANLTSLLTSLPRAVLDQSSFFDKTTTMLAGLNKETDNMAEANKKAAKELNELMRDAASSPYKIDALIDSYTKLKAADVANPDGFLTGLVNTTAKFGKSSEELKRAAVAIQQMSGKGILSMEELRQQFGEAVPTAMELMARAANMSIGELVQKVSTGTVEAKKALKLLSREMYLSSAGSAEAMSRTWEGAVNKITTSLTLLTKRAGDAGFYKEMNQMAKDFNTALMSDGAINAANNIGRGLTTAAQVSVAAIQMIAENAKKLAFLFGTMFGVSLFNKIVGGVTSVIDKVKTEIAKWPESTKVVQNQMLELTRNFNQKEAELHRQWVISRTVARDKVLIEMQNAHRAQYAQERAALQQRLSLLQQGQSRLSAITNSVVGLFGGWTGVIVTAIGVALYALDEFWYKQRRIADDMIKTGGLMSTFEDVVEAKKSLTSDKEDKSELEDNITSLTNTINELGARSKLTKAEINDLLNGDKDTRFKIVSKINDVGDVNVVQRNIMQIEVARKKLVEVNDRIRKAEESLKVATNVTNEQMKNRGEAMMAEIMTDDLKKASEAYSRGMDEANKKANEASDKFKNDGKKRQEEYNRVFAQFAGPTRKQAISDFENVFSSHAKKIKDEINSIQSSAPSENGLPILSDEQFSRIKVLEGQLEKLKKDQSEFNRVVAVGAEGIDQLAKAAKATGKIDPAFTYIQQSQVRTAGKLEDIKLEKVKLGLMDESEVKGKRLAQLEAAIAAGRFKGKEALISQMRIAAIAEDEATRDMATEKEKARIRRTALDRLDDLGISVAKKMGSAAAKTDNPFMEWQRAAEQTNEAIKEIENSLKKASGVMKEDKKRIDEINEKQRMTDQYNISAKLTESITDTQNAMLPSMQRTRAEYKLQIDRVNELLKLEEARLSLIIKTGAGTKEEAEAIKNNIEQIKKQRQLYEEQAMQNTTVFGIWKRSLSEMQDSITTKLADTFTGVFDAFAAGIVEGKDSFTDMMDSMAKDLEKFLVKMAMMQAFESAFGGFFAAPAGSNQGMPVVAHANGGVMTPLGSVPLRKYANGGIATSPQLALFGEGAHNEAYVPLPDGRTIPVTMTGAQAAPSVTLNMINQSGVQLEGQQQGSPRFDGERYIVDVIVNAVSRPGRLRTAIQGAK